MPIPLFDKLVSAFGGPYADANRVEIDRTNLTNVLGDNVQDVTNDLEGLFGTVTQIQADVSPSARPIVPFNDPITITAANIADYEDRNALYAAARDKRVDFLLPLEADISSYPAVFEIQHLGGTARFDTGAEPTNTVVVDTQATDTTSIESPVNTVVDSISLFRGDTVTIIKNAAGSNWIASEGSVDPRSSLLADNAFIFNTRLVSFSLDAVTGHYDLTGLVNYTPSKGEAFEVSVPLPADSTFGRGIEEDDVIVALVNDPSLQFDPDNTDWLIVPNAGHGDLTVLEMRFLSQIRESDTNVDTKITDDGAFEQLVWLSPGILATAPFLLPSSDTENPRPGETEEYVGGRESRNTDGEFTRNTDYPNANLYIGIPPVYVGANSIANIYVQFVDLNGDVVQEFNVEDDFEKPTFGDSSTAAYYVYSGTDVADTFKQVNYVADQRILIINRATNRYFTFSSSVNATSTINNLQESQLSQTVQGKLNSETALDAPDRERLDSIIVSSETSSIPSGFTYLFKYGEIDHDIDDYHSVNNDDGLFGLINATDVVIVVTKTVTVTSLSWSRGTIAVTQVTPSIFDSYNTYTASIPAFSGTASQSPLDFPITLTATQSIPTATGLDDDLKVGTNNLTTELELRIENAENHFTLPDNLQRLSEDLTTTSGTTTTWKTLTNPYGATFTRLAAIFWDENRHAGNFTGNYFDDVTGVDFTFNASGVYYFTDPDDSLNTEFPGFSSYLEHHNLAITNTTGETPITDVYTKLIKFKYRVKSSDVLSSIARTPLLLLGTTTEQEVLAIDSSGLVAVQGNEDGSSVTETTTETLFTDTGSTAATVAGSTTQTVNFIATAADTYTINAYLFGNGASHGVDSTNTITITDLGTPVAETDITFNYTVDGNAHTQNASVRFGAAQNRIRIEVPGVTDNANFDIDHLVITVTRDVSTTYTSSTTYSDVVIDRNVSVNQTGEIILIFEKTNGSSTASDPFLSIKAVHNSNVATDGVREDNVVNLHRVESTLDFNNINFGAGGLAITQVEVYEYAAASPGDTPNHAQLRDMLIVNDIGLGVFGHPTTNIDTFKLNANWEIEQGEALILTSPDDTRYEITVGNDGSLVSTEIT